MALLEPQLQLYVGERPTILARVTTRAKALVPASSVDFVRVELFDLASATPATPIHVDSLDATDVNWSDTGQQDDGWPYPQAPFSMEHQLDTDALPLEGGNTYRIEYEVRTTEASGIGPIKFAALLHFVGTLAQGGPRDSVS